MTIPDGTLRGIKAYSQRKISFYAFLQIPFAKPPVGELRFKVSNYCPWNTNLEHECPVCNFSVDHTLAKGSLQPVVSWVNDIPVYIYNNIMITSVTYINWHFTIFFFLDHWWVAATCHALDLSCFGSVIRVSVVVFYCHGHGLWLSSLLPTYFALYCTVDLHDPLKPTNACWTYNYVQACILHNVSTSIFSIFHQYHLIIPFSLSVPDWWIPLKENDCIRNTHCSFLVEVLNV